MLLHGCYYCSWQNSVPLPRYQLCLWAERKSLADHVLEVLEYLPSYRARSQDGRSFEFSAWSLMVSNIRKNKDKCR